MASENDQQNERAKGHVKWFNDQKGYGFITPDDDGEDLFVHHSGIKDSSAGFRSLGDGEAVEFEIEHSNDGSTKAVNVIGPDGGPVQGASRGGGGGYGDGGGRSGNHGGERYRGGGGGYGGGGSRCFKCGESGHLARDCYQGGSGGGRGGRYGGDCFKCGEDGHFARDCPNSGC